MKILSLALLLMASMAFVLAGCSDISAPVASPTEQTSSTQSGTPSLAKGGPVVHSVTGSTNIQYGEYWEGKEIFGTLTISGRLYADGSCDGEYEFIDHVVEWKDYNKTHGKILSLKFYDNKVLVGGEEVSGVYYKGWFDAFLLVDNGQGTNASNADMRSWIYCEPPDNCDYIKSTVWRMMPEEFVTFEETTIPTRSSLMLVTQGNLQIR